MNHDTDMLYTYFEGETPLLVAVKSIKSNQGEESPLQCATQESTTFNIFMGENLNKIGIVLRRNFVSRPCRRRGWTIKISVSSQKYDKSNRILYSEFLNYILKCFIRRNINAIKLNHLT